MSRLGGAPPCLPSLCCWHGSRNVHHTCLPLPTHRTLLAKEQARIRQQYEERLRDLEAERQGMAEDKAQVCKRAAAGGMGPLAGRRKWRGYDCKQPELKR